MPGINSYPDGSFIVLKHHNWAYTYEQALHDTGGFLRGKEISTVGQLIEKLKECNPNSSVLIYSDHSTIGPLILEDIKEYDPSGDEINNEEDDNEY